jgi:nicotinate phosphoribosyltransferase
VRPDTGGNLVDRSLEPLGDKKLDRGVNARLVFKLRREIDRAYEHWDVPFTWLERARQYCRNVKITVTGGFTPKKIRDFEENGVPADVYGVGSYLFSNSSENGTNNDFTADIVRVEIGGVWYDLAKIGRQPCDNPALERVDLSTL